MVKQFKMEDIHMNIKKLFLVGSSGVVMATGAAFGMENTPKKGSYVPPYRRAISDVKPVVRESTNQQTAVMGSFAERYIQGKTPDQVVGNLIWLASQGKLQKSGLSSFIAAGVDINAQKNGRSVLHWVASNAADRDQYKNMRGLLVGLMQVPGINVNIQDIDGKTPLQWAAGNGNLGAVCTLLKFGAEINAQDKAGATALHWAAFKGHTNVVTYLLKKGAKLYAQDKLGATPLSRAVSNNKLETIKELLKNYTDNKNNHTAQDLNLLTLPDNEGKTALHWTASEETAQLLIDFGFPKDIKDNNGHTPYDTAFLKGFFNTARVLKI